MAQVMAWGRHVRPLTEPMLTYWWFKLKYTHFHSIKCMAVITSISISSAACEWCRTIMKIKFYEVNIGSGNGSVLSIKRPSSEPMTCWLDPHFCHHMVSLGHNTFSQQLGYSYFIKRQVLYSRFSGRVWSPILAVHLSSHHDVVPVLSRTWKPPHHNYGPGGWHHTIKPLI